MDFTLQSSTRLHGFQQCYLQYTVSLISMSAHAVDEAVRPSCQSTSFTLPFLCHFPSSVIDNHVCLQQVPWSHRLDIWATQWFKKNEGFSDIVPIERKHEVIWRHTRHTPYWHSQSQAPCAVRLFEQATRVSSDKLSNMTDGYILCVLLAVQV